MPAPRTPKYAGRKTKKETMKKIQIRQIPAGDESRYRQRYGESPSMGGSVRKFNQWLQDKGKPYRVKNQ